MDKTEQFSEAIYTTMEGTFERIIKRLSSKNTFSDKRYEFVRQLYQSLDNQDKKLFSGFIKGIFSDTIASILADIDGVSDANYYPCENIKIVCDEEELNPWIQELFIAIFQEKNPDME